MFYKLIVASAALGLASLEQVTANQACSSDASGGTCTPPAIADTAGVCAAAACDATDFGDATTNCCKADPCTAAVNAQCATDNKDACTSGNAACGSCKTGYYDKLSDGVCVQQQACSADATGSSCTAPAVADAAGTCAADACVAGDFGDAATACCKADPCTAAVNAQCATDNKDACTSGNAACGSCKTGYYDKLSDGVCVQQQACSA